MSTSKAKWATADEIRIQNLQYTEKVGQKLKDGYSLAWEEMGDALATIFVSYGMFVQLPQWLMLPASWSDSTLKLRHGAYLAYKIQTEDDMMVAYNLAALGNYSSANIILRACMEYLLRGTFFDCIAKRSYRETTNLLERESKEDDAGEKGSIQRLLDDINRLGSGFLDELECESAAILDKLSVFMSLRSYREMFPTLKAIVEQIDNWKLFYPIEDAKSAIYDGGYHILSLPAHGSIDHIDSGRRLLDGKVLTSQPSFDYAQFTEFISNFYQLLDVGLVVSFNVMKDNSSGVYSTVSTLLSHPMFQQLPLKSFKSHINMLKLNE